MDEAAIPHAIELLVGLLGLAAVVAIVARPLRLPYTVALVVAGLLVGIVASAAGYPSVDVSPDLVLLVLLPGLVFEAAYRLRIAELRRWFGGLALPGGPRRPDLGGGRRDGAPEPRDRPPPRSRLHRRGDGLGDGSGRGRRDVQATSGPARAVHDRRRREPPQRRHRAGAVRDRGRGRVCADRAGRGDRHVRRHRRDQRGDRARDRFPRCPRSPPWSTIT